MSKYTRIPLILIVCLHHSVLTCAGRAAVPGITTVLQTGTETAEEGQTQSSAEATPPKPELSEKRADAEQRLRVAQKTLHESDEDETTSTSTDAQEVNLLKQLNLVYAQQQSALQRTEELEAGRTESENSLAELREHGPREQKPYSFFLQESLQDSLVAHKARLKSIKATTDSLTEALTRAKENLQAKEKQCRAAKEKLAANSDPALAPDLTSTHKLATLEREIAAAEVEVRQSELTNVKLENATLLLQVESLVATLQWIEKEVTFSEDDLNQRLREQKKLEDDIDRKSTENNAELSILHSEWGNARQRLEHAERANKPTRVLEAEVEAKRLAHNLRNNRPAFFTKQKALVGKLREIWKWRHRVANHQFEIPELATWQNEVELSRRNTSSDKVTAELRLEELRKNLADVEQALAQEGTSDVQRWRTYERDVLREQIEFLNDHLACLEATDRTAKKLTTEIRERTNQFSLAEWAGIVWDKVVHVWEYELTSSEDDQPLRVSAVVCGLLLLVLGYVFSRRVSGTLGTSILPRLGIEGGGASALQSLSFYALLFASTLMALKVVSVPLTMFTFLGGAAAIGIGFGSQNILNNFISGLIMLTEQPVRVGDLIELNGLIGLVDSIGMRSTKIRTGNNFEIIVPNSSFLENNVVNWTLADSTIRCQIDVGVTYGSPTREVAKWLKRAAEEHGLVIGKPEPFVWFAGFGDNSLNFELYFFITIRTLSERRRIESDLRFMIDQYFRDAGISIAFPQRDIHLDTRNPLEVRMLPLKQATPVTEETSEPKAA